MTTRVEIKTKEVISAVKGELVKRLNVAAMSWVREAKKEVSEPSPPPPNSKGGWPGKRSGHLRRNITQSDVDVSEMSVQVGTNVEYGKWLEVTQKPFKRPWMSLTNKAMARRIRQIFSRKMK